MITNKQEFVKLLAQQRVIPVSREFFYDFETPIGIYQRLAGGRPGTFLLESAPKSGVWSDYSFIGIKNFGILSSVEQQSVWLGESLNAEQALPGFDINELPSLTALGELYRFWAGAQATETPLTGGLVGFIAWEAIHQIEDIQVKGAKETELPHQSLFFVSELIALHHKSGKIQLISNVLNPDLNPENADALWQSAQDRLDDFERLFAKQFAPALQTIDSSAEPQVKPVMSPERHLENIDIALKHIQVGDVFQVVLSQRFDHELNASAVDVYRVLRALNPSPYMYLLSFESPAGLPFQVVGSSPEALVKIEKGTIISHPIAGSRPRGATAAADDELEAELRADAKERSEHLMLVDLARNDLNKVSEADSIEVSEFMRVEKFSHIMHLVSTVSGKLRKDKTPIDALIATFPAGTLSGAPKPWALGLITELEPTQRQIYGGVVGYFDFSGDSDLAIAIRTATLLGDRATVQSGGGIVAESQPQAELQETYSKAAAPLKAIAVANTLRHSAASEAQPR